MARKPIKRKAARDQERSVNWQVIVGIILAAVVFLGILVLVSNNSSQDAPQVEQQGLIAYCDENPENCVIEGNQDASVTLLEVFDFACIHCRNFNQEGLPALKNLYYDSGQVRFVTLPFASRPETLAATNASLCANEQGAYADYNSALFSQFGETGYLTNPQLLQTAVSIGLDQNQFATCMEDGRYNIIISENVGYAHSIGVSSTPNFFVNEMRIEGNQPQLIQQRIEMALGN